MAIIPGLPVHLETVPPAPFSADDPFADEKRAAWRQWRHAVQQHRTQLHLDLRKYPELIPFERLRCAQHPAYWAAMWLRVFEPRWRVDGTAPIPFDLEADDPDAEKSLILRMPDLPRISTSIIRPVNTDSPDYEPWRDPIFGYVPFICYEKQVEVINRLLWSLDQTDENADVFWSKCRGWGATWIGALIGLWGWTFSQDWPGSPPWNVLMLSRKEELVDSKQQRSIFWKIRRLMRDMPEWQLPVGWNPDLMDQKMVILNPENGNELAGESTTTKAGRGDRVTFAWLDELSAMPNADDTWATLAETTDHRWGVYTESLEEGSFTYDNGIGRKGAEDVESFPYLLESDWQENPLNDDVWLERQRNRYASKPEAFAREILRNPHEGVTTWVYPWAHSKEITDSYKPTMGYEPYITVDPGFRDPTVMIAVQEQPNDDLVTLDSYAMAGKEADYFAPLLKPELFESIPDWIEKEWITWFSPFVDENGNALSFMYDRRAIEFATTVHRMGLPKFIGDTYGESMVGSSKDSVYSRWRKYGIFINADRKTGDAITKNVRIGRTFNGRREAMNDRAARFQFAGTPGARMVLKALKQYKFKPVGDRPTQTEPKAPLHDWASHYATAMEFLAVYVSNSKSIGGRKLSPPKKAKLGGSITNMGAKRNAPQPLRGMAD